MAQKAIWIDSLAGLAACRQVTEAVAAQGFACRPLGGAEASGPGLVVFEDATPDLCGQIRRCSQGGARRVLAIALDGEALTATQSWRLLAAGASDVVAWNGPADPAGVIAARFRRWREVDEVVDSPLVRDNLIGRSPAWRSVLRQVVEVACFTDAPILVTGQSGTGKELVARLIHTLDRRPDKHDLVVLDCTTIVPELAGSEFFGHERGAFTSAVAARDGAFALADGGTLFLDEVGELPPTLQAELLRAVEEGSYKRVGSNAWRRTDFRLVCATNRDLDREVDRGTFRRDFYHRIAAWILRLPPLDDHREDIPVLARHFLEETFPECEPPEIDRAVRDFLMARSYPGNVRDLRHLVLRLGQRHVGCGPITVGDLPADERPGPEPSGEDWRDEGFRNALRRALARGVGLKQIGHAAAETAVAIALEDEQGNVHHAARKLGVTDRAVQMRRAACRKRQE